MYALSAKRTNKASAGFVNRMTAAGKPPGSSWSLSPASSCTGPQF
jgi:hypothetical protein